MSIWSEVVDNLRGTAAKTAARVANGRVANTGARAFMNMGGGGMGHIMSGNSSAAIRSLMNRGSIMRSMGINAGLGGAYGAASSSDGRGRGFLRGAVLGAGMGAGARFGSAAGMRYIGRNPEARAMYHGGLNRMYGSKVFGM